MPEFSKGREVTWLRLTVLRLKYFPRRDCLLPAWVKEQNTEIIAGGQAYVSLSASVNGSWM